MKRGIRPASADRTARALKAALNLAAKDDYRIINGSAWRDGLSRLPHSETPRNVILPDDQVRALVAAAYEIAADFGLLIEVAAVTGQRASQIFRLTVGDLQNGSAPRLLMPSSRKGKHRRVERRPLPIPPSLCAALKAAAGERPVDAPLLLRSDGSRWKIIDTRTFAVAVAKAGLDASVTPYALRHSSIVRQLLAGIPVRIVAASHDTSVLMLESTYSRYIIGDHSEALTRRALLDLGAPPASGNVVPIGGKP